MASLTLCRRVSARCNRHTATPRGVVDGAHQHGAHMTAVSRKRFQDSSGKLFTPGSLRLATAYGLRLTAGGCSAAAQKSALKLTCRWRGSPGVTQRWTGVPDSVGFCANVPKLTYRRSNTLRTIARSSSSRQLTVTDASATA